MDILLLSLIVALTVLFVTYQIIGWRKLAPWVPSNMVLLDQGLRFLNLPSNTKFIDLGAGDGRAVFLASKKYHFQATGIEISPLIWLISKIRQFFVHSPVDLKLGDVFKTNLSSYKVIYFYSLPDMINRRLLQKIQQECQPDTYIISYNFSLANKEAVKIIRDHWRSIKIYKV